MRRDAIFGIGDAEVQVKEERETDKSNIILVFQYPGCRNFKKNVERETDMNFVSWIAEIQFPLDSFFR